MTNAIESSGFRGRQVRISASTSIVSMFALLCALAAPTSASAARASFDLRAAPFPDVVDLHTPGRLPPREPAPPAGALCVDGAGSPAVLTRWNLEITKKGVPVKILFATIENTTRDKVVAKLHAKGVGLGQRVAERTLRRVRLEPGQKKTLRLPVKRLPVQSIGAPSAVEIYATVAGFDGADVVVPSAPLHVEFLPGYDRAVVSRVEGARERFAPSEIRSSVALAKGLARMTEPLRRQTGRFFDSARRKFVTVGGIRNGERVAHYGQVAIAIDSIQADRVEGLLSQFEDLPSPKQPWPPQPKEGVRMCASWRAAFVDAGFGEDYLAEKGLQLAKARFARAILTTGADQLVWQGVLDAQGCSDVLPLTDGEFIFILIPEMHKDGANIDISFREENGVEYSEWFLTSFSLFTIPNSPPGLSTIHVASGHDDISRVSAVISQILVTPDNGVPATTIDVLADSKCHGNPNSYSACAGNKKMWIGERKQGDHNSQWKYVIAHEFGHVQQRATMGMPRSDYDEFAPAEPACRCDHVVSANKKHCMQSLEEAGVAQIEGWAQFYAAKAFNNPYENDCTHVYYKEYLYLDKEFPSTHTPPVPRDCRGMVRWHYNYCWHPGQDVSTEHDWMNFLWSANTVSSSKSSMDDLATIFRTACTGGSGLCSSGTALTWPDFAAASELHFGGVSHPQHQHFLGSADDHKVND